MRLRIFLINVLDLICVNKFRFCNDVGIWKFSENIMSGGLRGGWGGGGGGHWIGNSRNLKKRNITIFLVPESFVYRSLIFNKIS